MKLPSQQGAGQRDLEHSSKRDLETSENCQKWFHPQNDRTKRRREQQSLLERLILKVVQMPSLGFHCSQATVPLWLSRRFINRTQGKTHVRLESTSGFLHLVPDSRNEQCWACLLCRREGQGSQPLDRELLLPFYSWCCSHQDLEGRGEVVEETSRFVPPFTNEGHLSLCLLCTWSLGLLDIICSLYFPFSGPTVLGC